MGGRSKWGSEEVRRRFGRGSREVGGPEGWKVGGRPWMGTTWPGRGVGCEVISFALPFQTWHCDWKPPPSSLPLFCSSRFLLSYLASCGCRNRRCSCSYS